MWVAAVYIVMATFTPENYFCTTMDFFSFLIIFFALMSCFFAVFFRLEMLCNLCVICFTVSCVYMAVKLLHAWFFNALVPHHSCSQGNEFNVRYCTLQPLCTGVGEWTFKRQGGRCGAGFFLDYIELWKLLVMYTSSQVESVPFCSTPVLKMMERPWGFRR